MAKLLTGTRVYGTLTVDTNATVGGNLTVTGSLLLGYTTTATAAGTTTLTSSSTATQFFTGTTTQTVVLPVTSTLTLGQNFYINNNSTGTVSVQSSGGNLLFAQPGGTTATYTVILTSGTTAASWSYEYSGFNGLSGTSSNLVTDTSPTLITPTLGVASATSINKVAITAPATSATLTLAQGSTLATSGAYSITLTAGATTNVTLPNSGYVLSSVANPATNPVTGTPSSTNFLRGDGTWSTAVTSVAQTFTGGLISVSGSPVTGSGTLALTVAGTSGGIPYFSSTSTWASSAALALNAIVLGGGAGAAPATTATGTGVVTALGNNVTGSGGIVLGTGPTISLPVIDNPKFGYTTTATSGGTTTLTSASNLNQVFTGSAAQTVVLPVVSTLAIGQQYIINNNSSVSITVQSSGANTILVQPAGMTVSYTVVSITGTTAASWNYEYTEFSSVIGSGSVAMATGSTGSGNIVYDNTPTLITPVLGVASATSINKVTITAPATSATLTLANGSTLATSGAYSMTLTTTGTTALTMPTSGYVVSTASALTGTPSSTTYVRGDSTWGEPVQSGVANHLAYYPSSTATVNDTAYAVVANNGAQLTLGDNSSTNGGSISFKGETSGTVTITSAAVTAGWVMTLPPNAGAAGYVLSTDGSGGTSWIAATVGGGGTGGGAASVTVSSSAPGTPHVGDLWWNPPGAVLSVYESSASGWVDTSGNNQDWGLVTGLITIYDDYGSV